MIAILAVLGLVSAGLSIGYIITSRAPLGYEDQAGFHFGSAEGAIPEEVHYKVPEPKLV